METEITQENKSSKSNIIFWIVFFLILFGSVAFTYYRIMIKRDYLISAEAECDPYAEKCFIYECDPETEECTGDPEEDTYYYKLIKRKAFNIPSCNSDEDEDCESLVCLENEEDCSYELCEEGNEDGIECVDPVQYALDNPEEEEECEEGDEECLAESEEECEEGDEECLTKADSEESEDEESEEGGSGEEELENEETEAGNELQPISK
jgi:hypothetical protein